MQTKCDCEGGLHQHCSADYHIELAGGGHYNTTAFRSKIAEVQKLIPAVLASLSIHCISTLVSSPSNFPLWQKMRKEGLPMEGFCVAVGISTMKKAVKIIMGLKAACVKRVAFKPGSVNGIRHVINIAAANPDFPIIMQWTSGRVGGHHSFEYFHQFVLATYRAIRQLEYAKWKMFGNTSWVTGLRSALVCSQCPLVGSCSPVVLWLPRRCIRGFAPS